MRAFMIINRCQFFFLMIECLDEIGLVDISRCKIFVTFFLLSGIHFLLSCLSQSVRERGGGGLLIRRVQA